MHRLRWFLLFLLPALAVTIGITVEELFWRDVGGRSLGGSLSESIKTVISLDTELAKWFIGLASALIGGTVYYIRRESSERIVSSRFSSVAIILSLAGSVISIYFGHLWLANIRNQLASDYFVPTSVSLIWPERLQYLSFLCALVWFALLMADRETTPTPADGSAEQVASASPTEPSSSVAP